MDLAGREITREGVLLDLLLEQRVIDGLDLDIAPGEFVALLGASGSGKTTLLRTLAGLDSIDSGQLRVPLARAAVFQEPRLMPWKNAWKNVVLGEETLILKEHQILAKLKTISEDAGITVPLDVPVQKLSVGERQQVE